MEKGATPTIVTAEDMIARFRAGIQETYEIRLRKIPIMVRVLSIDEINGIRRQAKQTAALIKGGDETDANVEIQKTTLTLASTIKGIPLLTDKVLGMFSLDEVQYLYNEYIKVMDEVNPNLDSMTNEQFRSLVDALKKSEITANDCSIPQLKEICSAYVDLILRQELVDLHKANSSGGSPFE
jgi:hypothetical protein